MGYTLYGSPDSANLVVRMALEELAADYGDVHVDRSRGANRDPDYLGLNPQGLLPALRVPDQDEPIFETGAILLFLADRHQALIPQAAKRGRALKWLFFLSNTVHADLRIRFYTNRFTADAAGIDKLRSGLETRVVDHFALLNNVLAGHGKPWLTGDTLSICDLYLGALARWAQLYPKEAPIATATITSQVRLAHHLERLAQRPAIRRAMDREGITGHPFVNPVAAHLA